MLGTLRTVCRVEPMSLETHDRGFALRERYGFSIYDSMILASALLAGCEQVFTEDLQDGQCIDGMRILAEDLGNRLRTRQAGFLSIRV